MKAGAGRATALMRNVSKRNGRWRKFVFGKGTGRAASAGSSSEKARGLLLPNEEKFTENPDRK
jgi:hypothetical protein